ncbi:MAG TPA: EamA family transporter, partial [Cyanobacteria bacterium UBA11372]|nr:EamA family transporter [Cyanobacteria bacterium UBA11372]
SVWAVGWWVPNLIPAEKITILAVFGAVLVVGGSIAIALGKKSVNR